jgi:hypothetical protein
MSLPRQKYSALDNQQEASSALSFDPNIATPPAVSVEPWSNAKHMSGGRSLIVTCLLCITLPMLGLSALLIGLILGYEIDSATTDGGTFSRLQSNDGSAYYVNFNATTLATIASWSSTVAPILSVAAMTLASFAFARRYAANSSSNSHELPTSFQLGLLLETFTGGVTAFWSLLRYRSWDRKESLVSIVRNSFVVLFLASFIG